VLVAVPPGVVTASGPVVALAGTVAVICVLESTWNAAAMPSNRTAVAPVKLLPVMTTLAPGSPLWGVNPPMRGVTVKVPALVTGPNAVPTRIGPVVAPAGAVAVILVVEVTV
jgi:hypothetical protein